MHSGSLPCFSGRCCLNCLVLRNDDARVARICLVLSLCHGCAPIRLGHISRVLAPEPSFFLWIDLERFF